MTSAATPQSPAITLDALVALNDEIAALTRAGIPLERGLLAFGGDAPGRLGQLSRALARRAENGETLDQLLADPSLPLPPAYRAVVTAGMRAGRLPAALEAMADAVRRLADTHRSVFLAALYPLLVAVVACPIAALLCTKVAPQMLETCRAFGAPGLWILEVQVALGRWAEYWGLGLPALIVAVALFWWWRSQRAAGLFAPRWSAWLVGWIPWMGRAVNNLRAFIFTDVLALLVEHDLPLDEALPLAAAASGDARYQQAAARLAAAHHAGRTDAADAAAVFPPFAGWLAQAAGNRSLLCRGLRQAAEAYRRRAQQQAELLRVVLPVLFTVCFAGAVTLWYAVCVFLPYTTLLYRLGS